MLLVKKSKPSASFLTSSMASLNTFLSSLSLKIMDGDEKCEDMKDDIVRYTKETIWGNRNYKDR